MFYRLLIKSTVFMSAILLSACGGGGSSDVAAADPPAPPITTPLTVPGAYVASLNGKDWAGILLRTTGLVGRAYLDG